jgi:ElaA protein
MGEEVVRSAAFADLSPRQLHDLLRLRADVFVVEQQCVYPDLDGRDTEPDARHYWIEDGTGVLACLRRLVEPDGAVRLGRIATRVDARRRGLAARLLDAATEDVTGPVVLDAQEHLEAWYEELGYRRTGATYVEDGIPHVPMRREAPE